MNRAVSSLQARVDNPVINMFCVSLEQLTNPELVWKDLMESDILSVMERTSGQRDKKVLLRIWDEIKGKLIQVSNNLSTQYTYTEIIGVRIIRYLIPMIFL